MNRAKFSLEIEADLTGFAGEDIDFILVYLKTALENLFHRRFFTRIVSIKTTAEGERLPDPAIDEQGHQDIG